jgi:hypothetical protein
MASASLSIIWYLIVPSLSGGLSRLSCPSNVDILSARENDASNKKNFFVFFCLQ